jgi:hypothetical protein
LGPKLCHKRLVGAGGLGLAIQKDEDVAEVFAGVRVLAEAFQELFPFASGESREEIQDGVQASVSLVHG